MVLQAPIERGRGEVGHSQPWKQWTAVKWTSHAAGLVDSPNLACTSPSTIETDLP